MSKKQIVILSRDDEGVFYHDIKKTTKPTDILIASKIMDNLLVEIFDKSIEEIRVMRDRVWSELYTGD